MEAFKIYLTHFQLKVFCSKLNGDAVLLLTSLALETFMHVVALPSHNVYD